MPKSRKTVSAAPHNGARSVGCVDLAVAGWLRSLREKGYSPRTLEIYRTASEEFGRFLASEGVSRVQDAAAGDIEAFVRSLSGRGLRPSSVSVYLRAVRRFYAHLVGRREAFLNPAAGIAVRVRRPLVAAPSEEEIRRLLGQPDTSTPLGIRDRALLETAYGTGARVGELHRLRADDIDLEEATARLQGKGKRERVVPLGVSAAGWLSRYLSESRPRLIRSGTDMLWIGNDGMALGYPGTRVAILHHARAAGLAGKCSPHGIRRACATHMLRRGAQPVEIQLLLGHASMRHLSQYLRLSIADIKAAHERSKPGR